MSRFLPLWIWLRDSNSDELDITFTEIEKILSFPIDHSFLNAKKELTEYGYKVVGISMKEQRVFFEKLDR